jgi:hypothetical protein
MVFSFEGSVSVGQSGSGARQGDDCRGGCHTGEQMSAI